MDAETAIVLVSPAEIRAVAETALRRAGCDDANARATAQVLARAEEDGCASHGLFRLPGFLAALRCGKARGDVAPAAARLAPGVVRIDGGRALSPLATAIAREKIADMARESGIAAAAITNVHHFSALWVDIEPLVESGLGALCCTAYVPFVAPAGANRRFFGTNAMAFGFPTADGGFLFDQASAATARGELQIAARDGRLAPEGAGVGPDGAPTRDPAQILLGAQSPFGGHKGSSIALMVELLAGVLIGQPTSPEAGREEAARGALENTGPPNGGVLMIAFDPDRFGDPEGWRAHGERFFAELRALPGVRLPGDRRRRERERISREGVMLPTELWRGLRFEAGLRETS
ncbi:MAG: Ldh family oxidoreductase [Hyphomicrobiales bacterium]|nr:Ldh family oxidoreductase [Hyphomicrobiales bacterium]